MKKEKKRMMDGIVELLKEKDMTAQELAKHFQTYSQYLYSLLQRLENEGKIERKKWMGAWVWGLKK
ncbi:MAG: winged helix-turn-helix domain-containing protein [Candidatus Omnitrophica bacterium]|nr:winged helix-turn-helix domain-containing protein [Candidatus Omnitrophota bacterium]